MMRKPFKDRCGGAVAVEVAIVLPMIFLLFAGVVNFGFILSNITRLTSVAGVGMLYAFGNSSEAGLVEAAMTNSDPDFDPLTVSATIDCICLSGETPGCGNLCSDSTAPSRFVTVTASSQVDLFALGLFNFYGGESPFTGTTFDTSVTGTIRTVR